MDLLKRHIYLCDKAYALLPDLTENIIKDFKECLLGRQRRQLGMTLDAPSWLDMANEEMVRAALGNCAFVWHMYDDPDLVMGIIEVAGVNSPEIVYLTHAIEPESISK